MGLDMAFLLFCAGICVVALGMVFGVTMALQSSKKGVLAFCVLALVVIALLLWILSPGISQSFARIAGGMK